MRPLLPFVLCFLLLAGACRQQQRTDTTAAAGTTSQLVTVPEKSPLILLTDRPPNLETPLRYFLEDLTPNKVFFVRWHLAGLPEAVREDTFRLRIGGDVAHPLSLSLTDLKTKFRSYSTIALCACAGNARSCFKPRVPGAQWVNGGMGNARWTGVLLKDVLAMAGVQPGAKFVSFNGLDAPPLGTVPDFEKSLPMAKAADGEVMIAYMMNDEPLPLLNGYPLKLVVPGWYATYWVGMLSDIKVHTDSFKGFWMDKAYLVPKGVINGAEQPEALAEKLEPISKMDVRSIFVSPEPGATLAAGKAQELQGLAFDGGDGIVSVALSTDSCRTWTPARLDPSLGKYSWRRWRYTFQPDRTGSYTFWVRATNAAGQTQPPHQWNRSGYMRNEIESLTLKAE